jgi:hypothetical protein
VAGRHLRLNARRARRAWARAGLLDTQEFNVKTHIVMLSPRACEACPRHVPRPTGIGAAGGGIRCLIAAGRLARMPARGADGTRRRDDPLPSLVG